jgi:hypothetical protein
MEMERLSAGTKRVRQLGHGRACASTAGGLKPSDLQEKRARACPRVDGRTVVWFGTNGKVDPDTGEAFGKGETTFTFNAQVIFTDATRISFHQVGHVVFDETGVVKLEFFKEKAHCG